MYTKYSGHLLGYQSWHLATLFQRESMLGAAVTSYGRVHHRWMVSQKKDHFSIFVLAAGIQDQWMLPLVVVSTGINWSLGM